MAIEYKNGELYKAYTLDEHLEITHHAKTMLNIPMKLKSNIDITIFGTATMKLGDFNHYNAVRKDKDKLISPSYCVCKAFNSLSSEYIKEYSIRFYANGSNLNFNLKTKREVLLKIASLGINIVTFVESEKLSSISEGVLLLSNLSESTNYALDGVTYYFNDIKEKNLNVKKGYSDNSIEYIFMSK